ncbi:phosphodiester glycosidase family protein [Haloferula chungangensis]|uniref:Phosphodiester glycosidase family protein n=1 Tax=Haloferula chungangensis TaxID=1048331 RepID=A0ABW2L5W4_9BACT
MMMKGLGVLILSVGSLAAEVKEERVEHAGAVFRVVRLEPARVAVVWRGDDGKPYETFDRVQSALADQGKTLSFLMNAGIFEPGLVPSGLHVEETKELRPLNLREGKGNFFLKPNGVFAVTVDGEARVWSAVEHQTRSVALRVAVQSGPILLRKGQRHRAFRDGSRSVKHRNGVGVDGKGRVVFAMTDKRQEVNFWDFAGLFLSLGCKDALFLDGDISQMAVNPQQAVKSNRFAAMFVVVE